MLGVHGSSLSDVDDWHPTLDELCLKYPEVMERDTQPRPQSPRCNYPIDLNSSESSESVQDTAEILHVSVSTHPMLTRGEADETRRAALTEALIEFCGYDRHEASMARMNTALSHRRAIMTRSNVEMGKRARFTGKGSKHKRHKKRSLTNHRGADDRRWFSNKTSVPNHWSMSDVEDEY